MSKKYQQFIKQFPYNIKTKVSLSRYCTFGVGGLADLLIEAKSDEILKSAINLANKLNIPFLVIGGGSNIFFDDKGFRGLVIHYMADEINLDKAKKIVQVEAGCKLNKLVNKLAETNLGGIDFLANIPGSLGGAIVGNAGCYGNEIKNYLINVELLNCQTGKIIKINPAKLNFSYRHSKLKSNSNLIILKASLKLVRSNKAKILKAVRADKLLRKSKHPLDKSAGSFFKNTSDMPVWKIINQVGLKGKTIGGARVSEKHSNFIINYNSKAQASDINKLANKIIKEVKKYTGVILAKEVRFIKANGKIS